MIRPLRFIAASVACLVGSLTAALILLRAQNWFGASDIIAFLVFSVPYCLGVGAITLPLHAWMGTAQPVTSITRGLWLAARLAITALLSLLMPVVWTLGVALLLGPFFGAFSFGITSAWVGGTLVALPLGLFAPARAESGSQRRLVRGLLITITAGIIGIFIFNTATASQTRTFTYVAMLQEASSFQASHDQMCIERGFTESLAIELIQAPGYDLRLCTIGAASYLVSAGNPATFEVEFEVSYRHFQFSGFTVPRIGDWRGSAEWDSGGTLPCVQWTEGDQRGWDCGGDRSRKVTDEVFGFFH